MNSLITPQNVCHLQRDRGAWLDELAERYDHYGRIIGWFHDAGGYLTMVFECGYLYIEMASMAVVSDGEMFTMDHPVP